MRRLPTLSRAALPLAAAVALLTACSGGDEGDSAAPSAATEAPTSAAETSEPAAAPEADSEFCTQATALNDELDSLFTDQADPEAVEQSLAQAADGIRAIEPPAELDADWTVLADGLDELGAAYADLDPEDPASLGAFQERITTLQADLAAASTSVESYLTGQCGIDTGSEEPAAPSS